MRLRIFAAATLVATPPSFAFGETAMTPMPYPYVGMWVTDDGHIRHELLPNNRYDEARGTRESAYRGRYEVTGTHIEYWDDTGFTADGDFVDANTLHHAGMVLRRSAR
ncbi:hypothetical protein GCM10011390_26610 [Aureimonas endophytica]|uniref:Ligand-binding protein with streptavidin-like fold n=1 Tax=Aureimonas endophytica TaxID=2027858 RepID=A0A916ZNF9_9HYPH|nr:Atu4866 domain-containing protein [Aureimonas endophytica]GGE06179.1 hypothetical protein GCM10011390_26610 [Aureimonas endophytica]